MFKNKIWYAGCMVLLALTTGCKKDKIVDNTGLINTGTNATAMAVINTDKAFYAPGSEVKFTLDAALPAGAKVRYMTLGTVVDEANVSGTTWTWTAPATDFTGYMAELYGTDNGKEKVYSTIAVDVSSNPARFPRNGFLSAYGQISEGDMGAVMKNLNRYHLNYIQFQEWSYKHHMPLAGSVASPDPTWKDIASRDNYLTTVKGYIDMAHSYNMRTLSYNLAFGALNDAAQDGVSEEWYLFKDENHGTKDLHPLGAPFKSSIWLTNPGNPQWQNYIADKTNDAYEVFPFDGFQIDQLGNRGTLYSYSGSTVNLPLAYNSFINAMKIAAPNKALVMNAVNQYGKDQIAKAPVDFLYSEVWSPNESFKNLTDIIQENDALTGGQKKTVLAAYMNYDLANNTGYFNTPGVLLADAAIFAFGGAHLELGEHMLGKEYFPNSNLKLRDDLKAALVSYYDFSVAYQNLLRDGGTFNSPGITTGDNRIKLNFWPPQSGQVSVIGKDFDNLQVIHLINMANANSLNWRDANGTQTAPVKFADARFNFASAKTIKRIWMASPDVDGGAVKEITYSQSGNAVTFTLPLLWYWDMIVVEYE
ncbi:MAG: cycloisomaltooligosaccharide glucanotransferase [Sphingobacteriaceae bacterium]|nr:MAG: cycloisomaltooligosaccharide glucanotransferase [Sphingobacteriaceae bacterium]